MTDYTSGSGYQINAIIDPHGQAYSIAQLADGKYLVFDGTNLYRWNADFSEDGTYSPPEFSRAFGLSGNLIVTSLGVVYYGLVDIAGATTIPNTNQSHAILFSSDGESVTVLEDYGPYWSEVYPGYERANFCGPPVVWEGAIYGDGYNELFSSSTGALYKSGDGKFLDFMTGTFDPSFDPTFGGIESVVSFLSEFSNGDLLVTYDFAVVARVDADSGVMIESADLVGSDDARITGKFDAGFLISSAQNPGGAFADSEAVYLHDDFTYEGVFGIAIISGEGDPHPESMNGTSGDLIFGADGGVYVKGSAGPTEDFWTDLVGCTQ